MIKKFEQLFSIDNDHISKMRETPKRSVDRQFSDIMVKHLMTNDIKWSTYNAVKIELSEFDKDAMDEFKYRLVDDSECPNKVVLDILGRYDNLPSELVRLKRRVEEFDRLIENVLHYKTTSQLFDYMNSIKDRYFLFVDTETTGLGGPKYQQLTQISCIATKMSKDGDGYSFNEINQFNVKIKLTDDIKSRYDVPGSANPHSKTDDTIQKILKFNHYGKNPNKDKYIDESEALDSFSKFLEQYPDAILVFQNTPFDAQMLFGRGLKKNRYKTLDTKEFLQLYVIPSYQKLGETDSKYKTILDEKIKRSPRDGGLYSSSMSVWGPAFGINMNSYHDAIVDCQITASMFAEILNFLTQHMDLDIMKYQTERLKLKS